MEFLYEDCKSLLEQANFHEKELRHKRRWLIGLSTSRSEAGKVKGSKFQIERPIPEYLLREDDVSYETIKSFVEKGIGECNTKNKYHIVQDDMQLIHSPRDVASLLSLINSMTNQGLFQFASALTGGSITFEKTRWKMKQVIKKCLLEASSVQSNTRKINLFENHFSLLKNPHNFRWSSGSRFIPDTDSYHHAVHKMLNELESLPTQTLSAMHRKLRGIKGYMPKLVPKKTGWGRDTLIKGLRKKCLKLLSKLGEGDSLQEPLAKAMEVAGLTLMLTQGCHYVTSFKQFSPEINVLQNEIAMSIQLLDQRVKLSVLKDIQVLVDPNAKLSDRSLRKSITNLLTEFLFECSDMDTIPQCLLEVLAILRKKCEASFKNIAEMKINDEVEDILSLSASMKQILWDLIPEHEFDLDFADAYMEDLEESDDDIELEEDMENKISHSSNSDEEVGSTEEVKLVNSISVENSESRLLNFSKVNYSQRINSTQYHLVSLRNTEEMETDSPEDSNNQEKNSYNVSSGKGNLMFDDENMCKNQYLDVQAASDDASMVAYSLIGCMLNDFAQIERCELNSGDVSYLGIGSYDLKQKDHKARKESATHEEDSYSIIIKAVEELIPSLARREADGLKELMGAKVVRQ